MGILHCNPVGRLRVNLYDTHAIERIKMKEDEMYRNTSYMIA
jgi:hypothetical protein